MLIAVLLAGCSHAPLNPTKEHPIPGCHIGCPGGYSFRRQHMCRSDRRWFQDILITGSKTVRAADGTITTDVWITDLGDYPKIDVELGRCSSFIARTISQREPGRVGQHPGEDQQGRPLPQ